MINKEKNQKYILDNLDKYVLDSRGNFIHIDFTLGCDNEEDEKYVFIGKEAVSDWEEIIKTIASMILQNKEDWQVVRDNGYYIKNKRDGREMNDLGFTFGKDYWLSRWLIGELGYRGGLWEDYEEWKERKKEEDEKRLEEKRQMQEQEKKWREWWEQQISNASSKSSNALNPNPEVQSQSQESQSSTPSTPPLNQPTNQEPKPQTLNNSPKQETNQDYQDNKEEINNLKKDQATQNPTEYSQNAANKITKKMQEEGISEEDLNKNDNQTKSLLTSLKNGQIKDPTKIVAAENEIRQKVWQIKVAKEIQTLTSEVNQVLQSSKVKKQDITKLKQKLIEFLAKSNVYYSAQHQKAQALLTKLENYSNQSNNSTSSSPSSIPWNKIIIPILVVIVIVSLAVMVRMKKKLLEGRKRKK